MTNPNSTNDIYLNSETLAIVDLIQAKTSSPSSSAVIALMVARYGNHFLETWEVTSAQAPEQVRPVAAIASPVIAH